MAEHDTVGGGLLVTHRIPASAASAAVLAAVTAGKETGANVSAVIVDHNNVRISYLRDDGAGRHTEDVSLAKAYAAVSFAPIYGLSASGPDAYARASQSNPPFYPPDNMALRSGALTIYHGREVIGAIAVSGSAGQDEACARVGLLTLSEILKVPLDGLMSP